MVNKLTLTIEEKVIDSAKRYARLKGRSLSRIVENYLKEISNQEVTAVNLSPKVARLKGIIKLPEDFDYKTDVRHALIEKYR